MMQKIVLQRLSRAALILSAAALFFAVAFPHVHAPSSNHREESCRACKIQESFSAAAPAAAALPLASVISFAAMVDPIEAPSLDRVDSLHAPRSPPVIS